MNLNASRSHRVQATIGTASICALIFSFSLGTATVAHAQTVNSGPLVSTCTPGPLATDPYLCDLWAGAGVANIGPVSVNVRSYAATNVAPTSAIGPTLVVDTARPVRLTLHNNLPVGTATSLVLPAAVGVKPIVATQGTPGVANLVLPPGTYIYEASDARQIASGMVGALIVKPVGVNTVYPPKLEAFDDESVLVLSDIDPNFAAAPDTYSLRSWHSAYQLINGKVWTSTSLGIGTSAGRKVLLRYVNGGVNNHNMGVLGTRQLIVGTDARGAKHNESVVVATVRPGETIDALVVMPNRDNVPVYETATAIGMQTMLHNTGVATPTSSTTTVVGQTTTTATTTTTTTAPSIPAITSMTATLDASGNAVVNASMTIGAGSTIDRYNLQVNSVVVADTKFATPSQNQTITNVLVPAASLVAGTNTLTLIAKNGASTASAPLARTVFVDNAAPLLSGFTAVLNGTNVDLSFNANDTTTGNSNIVAAEYAVVAGTGAAPSAGTGTPLNSVVPPGAPSIAVLQSIPIGTTTDGVYTVYVRAKDAKNNWSAASSATVTIDKVGPTATALPADPIATNGVQASAQIPAGSIAIKAHLVDSLSNIAAAELFINTAGANGSGAAGAPITGLFDSPTEDVAVLVPATALVNALPAGQNSGNITLRVHGKDSAGNWGPLVAIPYIVDRTAPVVTSGILPEVTTGNISALTFVANDPITNGVASGIKRWEWFEGVDPGVGLAAQVTTLTGAGTIASPFSGNVTLAAPASGVHTVRVRVKDFAGNWGPAFSVTTAVNRIFVDRFTFAPLESLATVWSSVNGTPTIVNSGSLAPVGQMSIASNAPAYVVDTKPVAEQSYISSFDFTPGTLSGVGTGTLDIFSGHTNNNVSNNSRIFRVQFRRNGTQAQIRMLIGPNGNEIPNNGAAGWTNVANTTSTIRLDWVSASTAVVKLSIDGTLTTSTTINSSASRVEAVRLGVIGTAAIGTGPALFDNFQSARISLPA